MVVPYPFSSSLSSGQRACRGEEKSLFNQLSGDRKQTSFLKIVGCAIQPLSEIASPSEKKYENGLLTNISPQLFFESLAPFLTNVDICRLSQTCKIFSHLFDYRKGCYKKYRIQTNRFNKFDEKKCNSEIDNLNSISNQNSFPAFREWNSKIHFGISSLLHPMTAQASVRFCGATADLDNITIRLRDQLELRHLVDSNKSCTCKWSDSVLKSSLAGYTTLWKTKNENKNLFGDCSAGGICECVTVASDELVRILKVVEKNADALLNECDKNKIKNKIEKIYEEFSTDFLNKKHESSLERHKSLIINNNLNNKNNKNLIEDDKLLENYSFSECHDDLSEWERLFKRSLEMKGEKQKNKNSFNFLSPIRKFSSSNFDSSDLSSECSNAQSMQSAPLGFKNEMSSPFNNSRSDFMKAFSWTSMKETRPQILPSGDDGISSPVSSPLRSSPHRFDNKVNYSDNNINNENQITLKIIFDFLNDDGHCSLSVRVTEDIRRDISRTLPRHICFRGPSQHDALFQTWLFKILKAVAIAEPSIGYCQGLNFLASSILLFTLCPVLTFGLLISLLSQRGFRSLYNCDALGMALRLNHISALASSRLPQLMIILRRFSFSLDFWTHQWVATGFAYLLHPSVLTRLWPAFFATSWPVFYSLSLGILSLLEPILAAQKDSEGVWRTAQIARRLLASARISENNLFFEVEKELEFSFSESSSFGEDEPEWDCENEIFGSIPKGIPLSSFPVEPSFTIVNGQQVIDKTIYYLQKYDGNELADYSRTQMALSIQELCNCLNLSSDMMSSLNKPHGDSKLLTFKNNDEINNNENKDNDNDENEKKINSENGFNLPYALIPVCKCSNDSFMNRQESQSLRRNKSFMKVIWSNNNNNNSNSNSDLKLMISAVCTPTDVRGFLLYFVTKNNIKGSMRVVQDTKPNTKPKKYSIDIVNNNSELLENQSTNRHPLIQQKRSVRIAAVHSNHLKDDSLYLCTAEDENNKFLKSKRSASSTTFNRECEFTRENCSESPVRSSDQNLNKKFTIRRSSSAQRRRTEEDVFEIRSERQQKQNRWFMLAPITRTGLPINNNNNKFNTRSSEQVISVRGRGKVDILDMNICLSSDIFVCQELRSRWDNYQPNYFYDEFWNFIEMKSKKKNLWSYYSEESNNFSDFNNSFFDDFEKCESLANWINGLKNAEVLPSLRRRQTEDRISNINDKVEYIPPRNLVISVRSIAALKQMQEEIRNQCNLDRRNFETRIILLSKQMNQSDATIEKLKNKISFLEEKILKVVAEKIATGSRLAERETSPLVKVHQLQTPLEVYTRADLVQLTSNSPSSLPNLESNNDENNQNNNNNNSINDGDNIEGESEEENGIDKNDDSKMEDHQSSCLQVENEKEIVSEIEYVEDKKKKKINKMKPSSPISIKKIQTDKLEVGRSTPLKLSPRTWQVKVKLSWWPSHNSNDNNTNNRKGSENDDEDFEKFDEKKRLITSTKRSREPTSEIDAKTNAEADLKSSIRFTNSPDKDSLSSSRSSKKMSNNDKEIEKLEAKVREIESLISVEEEKLSELTTRKKILISSLHQIGAEESLRQLETVIDFLKTSKGVVRSLPIVFSKFSFLTTCAATTEGGKNKSDGLCESCYSRMINIWRSHSIQNDKDNYLCDPLSGFDMSELSGYPIIREQLQNIFPSQIK